MPKPVSQRNAALRESYGRAAAEDKLQAVRLDLTKRADAIYHLWRGCESWHPKFPHGSIDAAERNARLAALQDEAKVHGLRLKSFGEIYATFVAVPIEDAA